MPVLVRPATRRDVDAISSMSRQLRILDDCPPEHLTPHALLRDGFGPEPQFKLLVGELDGAVAGYALFNDCYEPIYAARGVYLCDLFVREEARRKGIGRALVAAVARNARARGRTFTWWASSPSNARAHAFYEGLKAFKEPLVAFVLFDAPFDALSGEAPSAAP